MRIPFLGGAYKGRSSNLDAQECINFFYEPETTSSGSDALIGTHGTQSWASLGPSTVTLRSIDSDWIIINEDITGYFVQPGDTVFYTFNGNGFLSLVAAVTNDRNGFSAIQVSSAPLQAANGTTINLTPVNRFVRGIVRHGDFVYAAIGSCIVRWNEAKAFRNVSSEVGYLSSFTGPVRMVSSGVGVGNQIGLADGTSAYILTTFPSNSLTVPSSGGYGGSNSIVFVDGRFLYDDKSSLGRFWYSNIYDGATVNALSFATAEGSPDKLQGIFADRRQIYLFGEETLEVWYNTGDINNPFQRFQGGFAHVGTVSIHTVNRFDNSIIWLGRDDRGQGQIFILGDNLLPQIVSTPSITWRINQISNISNAYAFTFKEEGHEFYCLSFPSGNLTLVYDAMSRQWHQWAINEFDRHIAYCHAFAFGKHLVGSRSAPRIYELSTDYYDDDGDPIYRRRTSQHIFQNEGMEEEVHIAAIQIEFEEGVGNFNERDPIAKLSWSKDGGNKFSTPKERSVGQSTDKMRRAVWRRLGHARKWTFRLEVSDPVKWVVSGAYARMYGEP